MTFKKIMMSAALVATLSGAAVAAEMPVEGTDSNVNTKVALAGNALTAFGVVALTSTVISLGVKPFNKTKDWAPSAWFDKKYTEMETKKWYGAQYFPLGLSWFFGGNTWASLVAQFAVVVAGEGIAYAAVGKEGTLSYKLISKVMGQETAAQESDASKA